MISSNQYYEELLRRYQANFDITENFKLGGRTYPAYAWFYSFSEKYVLKKEAQLWAIKAFEHVLFLTEDSVNQSDLANIKHIIETEAEPELVRKNEKYPEKDHMCSYLTFVILTGTAPDKETQKAIRKFHFDKGYLFNFRGHSEGRLAVVSMDTEEIFTNYSGRELKPMLRDIFTKLYNAA